MKAFWNNLRISSLVWPRALSFVLFASVVATLTTGLVSLLGTEAEQLEAGYHRLSSQHDQVQAAAILARDLALAQDGRGELRQALAKIADDLAASSSDAVQDLSLDSQLRAYVARLRALSKGENSRLASGDLRLKGIVEAMKGPLGQRLRQGLDERQAQIIAARMDSRQQMLLLIVLALGVVVIVGAFQLSRADAARPVIRVPVADMTGKDTAGGEVDGEALMAALAGLDQGVALFDPADKLVFFTPRLGEMFAGVLEPAHGQSWESFVRSILLRNESLAMEEGSDQAPANADEMLSQRLALPHGSVSKDYLPDGRCLEVAEYGTSVGGRIVLARDVTGIEHREAVRKLSDARTAAIVDTVFDGIIMINDEGLVETFNPAAEAIFGYSASEVIDQNVALLMPERYASSHDGYLRRYLDGGTPKVIGAITELQGRRRDGEVFPLEIAVNEVDATWILQERRRTPRRVFIASLRDITEQKALARQLQQSQKMEAIGTLAGGIAHDFNNILSVILGFTGLTLEDGQIDGEGQENLETVLEAANRARDLVQQILTFSRKGDQEKMRVGLQTVLTDALKMLRSTFPANIELRTDIDPRDLVVMADPTQMHQILMNLCTNAGQAMPGGGILEVKLQRVQIDGKTLQSFGMQGDGSCARLMVRDTGIGIDPATLERVFEPFYTTKPPGSGTGLGLSVVHGIVNEHGGHITVESAAGAGTTFTVVLPLAEAGEAVAAPVSGPVPHGKGRILFVDDETAVVRMADKILARLGYEVTGIGNSVDALRLFREQPDAFDLVITDHSMPDMTGDVLAAELRRIRQNIPVIICTGYSSTFTPEIATQAGLDGYILKPAMATDLGRMVHQVLGNSGA